MPTDQERLRRLEWAVNLLVGAQIQTYSAMIALWKEVPFDSPNYKPVSDAIDELSKRIQAALDALIAIDKP